MAVRSVDGRLRLTMAKADNTPGARRASHRIFRCFLNTCAGALWADGAAWSDVPSDEDSFFSSSFFDLLLSFRGKAAPISWPLDPWPRKPRSALCEPQPSDLSSPCLGQRFFPFQLSLLPTAFSAFSLLPFSTIRRPLARPSSPLGYSSTRFPLISSGSGLHG